MSEAYVSTCCFSAPAIPRAAYWPRLPQQLGQRAVPRIQRREPSRRQGESLRPRAAAKATTFRRGSCAARLGRIRAAGRAADGHHHHGVRSGGRRDVPGMAGTTCQRRTGASKIPAAVSGDEATKRAAFMRAFSTLQQTNCAAERPELDVLDRRRWKGRFARSARSGERETRGFESSAARTNA